MSSVRLHVLNDDLTGRIMCYRCKHSFVAPAVESCYEAVACPNCRRTDQYHHHRCAETDPFRHSLGWPYDNPTIPYDC